MGKVVMPDLNTGNSIKTRNEEKSAPKVTKVTKGAVKTSKESHKRGVVESFLENDLSDIGSYIWTEVIKPAIKNLLFDTFVGSVEMALFGTTNRSRSKGGSNASNHYVSYNKFSNNRSGRTDDYRASAGCDYQDVIFEERADAEQVLDTLQNLIDDYGQASIGDFYDAAGITPDDNFAKNEGYGWYDLRTARVMRNRDGYYISMPRERYLN